VTEPATVDETAPEAVENPWRPAGATFLAAFAVAWLTVALWAAYKNIVGDPNISLLAATQAGLALPTVVTASLVAGGALGVLGVGMRTRRLPRLAAGATGGLLVGLLGAGAVVLAYSRGSYLTTVAITVGVAAVVGGVLAAVRPTVAVAAGLAGTLATALLGLVKAYFEGDLLRLFGAGGEVESTANAVWLLQNSTSVLSGLAAGLVAFWYLRRSGLALPWPAYLLAGALPGLLLLGAEAAVWLGGGPLLRAVGAASAFDGQILRSLLAAGFQHSMIVFLVGGIAALIAVGRTMRGT
jgi:hypothetical protein